MLFHCFGDVEMFLYVVCDRYTDNFSNLNHNNSFLSYPY